MKLIQIFEGRQVEPGYVDIEKKRFWFQSQIKNDGTPDRRASGTHFGVVATFGGNYYGNYVVYNPEVETIASEIRTELAIARAKVKELEVQLYEHYIQAQQDKKV